LKRGLITWDKNEIRPEVFDLRLQSVRSEMSKKDISAIVVYSELWRSNQARFLTNFMPYFNRAFLIIPFDQPITLLCGLSPRVYGWIRSVTTIEDVRPAGNFARTLAQLASERGWPRVGLLDFDQFPWDLHRAILAEPLNAVMVRSAELRDSSPLFGDGTELVMRRQTAQMARNILNEAMPRGPGQTDYEFIGRLERQFRRAGAEDLILLVTNGSAVPAPADGQTLGEHFSLSLAVEYRGHWIRMSRAHGFEGSVQKLLEQGSAAWFENLGGSYPYEMMDRSDLQAGSIFAVHTEDRAGDKRVFYGDTFRYSESGPEVL